MGRSTADIPNQFLDPDHKAAFILWLNDLPVDTHLKLSIISNWCAYTSARFDHADYIAAGCDLIRR